MTARFNSPKLIYDGGIESIVRNVGSMARRVAGQGGMNERLAGRQRGLGCAAHAEPRMRLRYAQVGGAKDEDAPQASLHSRRPKAAVKSNRDLAALLSSFMEGPR